MRTGLLNTWQTESMVWFIVFGLMREFFHGSVSTWANIFFVPTIYREH